MGLIRIQNSVGRQLYVYMFLKNRAVKGSSADAYKQVSKQSKTQPTKQGQKHNHEQNYSSFGAVCAVKGLELRKEKLAPVT